MGRDTLDSIRKLKELKAAREASGKKVSEHIQPVLQSAGPPKKIGLIGKVKVGLQIVNIIKHHSMTKSWKTTLGGIVMALGPVAKSLVPGEYAWVGDALLSLGAFLLGASARDNGVSSQAAGIRPEVK